MEGRLSSSLKGNSVLVSCQYNSMFQGLEVLHTVRDAGLVGAGCVNLPSFSCARNDSVGGISMSHPVPKVNFP